MPSINSSSCRQLLQVCSLCILPQEKQELLDILQCDITIIILLYIPLLPGCYLVIVLALAGTAAVVAPSVPSVSTSIVQSKSEEIGVSNHLAI